MDSAYEKLFQRTVQGIKPGLDVITALLQAMDNPHQDLAAVHVAGTNGKGSVCAMLESVLRASGFRTGLYTSPHLFDFSERFRISGICIPPEKLDGYITRVEATADRITQEKALRPATFFEISTAIAFQYFADEGVDIAVIETGMGGRWDATNVIIPLISVITHIDVDHTDFLGDSLAGIAAEKAGIIKPGRPVVSAPQEEIVRAELQKPGNPVIDSAEMVTVMKSGEPQRLKIETPARTLPPVQLPLLGECQRENCAVAVAAMDVLAGMLNFDPAFREGLESVAWGARFQLLNTDPVVILDGAHNPSGARALIQTLRECYPDHQTGFILGFLDDKDTPGYLREIKQSAAAGWTIPIHAPRGTSADHAATLARAAGVDVEPKDVPGAWHAAMDWAFAEPNRIICITGSLYIPEQLAKLIPEAAVESGS